MRQILSAFLIIVIGYIPCFAFESTPFPEATISSVNNYNMVSNYQPNITPVGATQVTSYSPVQSNPGVPRRVGEHPQEPFQEPVGDVPVIAMICFICIYLFWHRKKEGT